MRTKFEGAEMWNGCEYGVAGRGFSDVISTLHGDVLSLPQSWPVLASITAVYMAFVLLSKDAMSRILMGEIETCLRRATLTPMTFLKSFSYS
jgi:hypothetical protein